MGILTLQWDHKFLVYRILCNRYAKHSGRHNVDRSRELLVMLMPPTGGNLHDDPGPASSPFLFQMSCMGWQNNFGTFSDSQYFKAIHMKSFIQNNSPIYGKTVKETHTFVVIHGKIPRRKSVIFVFSFLQKLHEESLSRISWRNWKCDKRNLCHFPTKLK